MRTDQLKKVSGELRRRGSASATHTIALRRGRDLGMWLGAGYPRSGTVWLCHLMATALEIPYPQNYEFPIAMRSVVHSHWRYDERLPRTIYIHRDGRDVLTSLYFYLTKSGNPQRNPLAMAWRRRTGVGLDEVLAAPTVEEQLLRLLELEIRRPNGSPLDWASHVREWRDRPDVAVIRYEDLLVAPQQTLEVAFANLGHTINPALISAAVAAHDFSARTGRKPGEASPTAFKRSGIAGDWRHHFTPRVAQAFDDYAGDVLVDLGYEGDRSWVQQVR